MRRVARLGRWCAFSMALLAAGAARADPLPTESATTDVGLPREQAEALLERAKALFRAGEFRQALPLVERAYALTESPRFLFNLGVLHHKLSECVPAREHFERYLERDPAGVARAEALAALEELRARCPAPPTDFVPAPPAPSRTPEHSVPTPPTAWSEASAPGHSVESRAPSWAPGSNALLLMGLGTAVGVGAVVALAAQGRAEDDIDDLGSQVAREGITWDELEGRRRELASNARLYRGLSLGLSAACLALVGAGATVWIVEVADGSNPRPGAAGIAYRGRF
jgi:tetratricopeptide (TPR) repeat protein